MQEHSLYVLAGLFLQMTEMWLKPVFELNPLFEMFSAQNKISMKVINLHKFILMTDVKTK